MKRILFAFVCFTFCGCTKDGSIVEKSNKSVETITYVYEEKSKPTNVDPSPVADVPPAINKKVEASKIVPARVTVVAPASVTPSPLTASTLQAQSAHDETDNEAVGEAISKAISETVGATPTLAEDSTVSGNPMAIYDSVARKLAGMDTENSSEYGQFIETKWKNLNENSLGAIEDWSKKHIIPHIGDHRTVFYPFGGPDVSCPFKFFPDAHTYILVGLEPIGKFGEVSKNIRKAETLKSLEKAFSSYLQRGFFITSEMSKDLSTNFLNGTLYLILPQLARLGFSISNVEELSINSNGQEVARSSGMVDCVRITCQKDEESAPRFVYYVRINLADSNSRLASFMSFAKKRTFITYLKSASYALHSRTLSKFKKFLLDNSKVILQDDTGVPFNDLGEKWQKYVFGNYEAPAVRVFKDYKQPSMAAFYRANSIVSIPFKIGYGFNRCKPSLLLAVMKNDATPAIPLQSDEAPDPATQASNPHF
ncbi:hypothetical protein FACS189449_01760 [Alphaproteobacteria bacterium]|nr:hypothetical protein FACS189449_01760 [Alphaproteobacteria bacterium]